MLYQNNKYVLMLTISYCSDFEDMSCEMIFGQEPPEDDPALKQPCFATKCKSALKYREYKEFFSEVLILLFNILAGIAKQNHPINCSIWFDIKCKWIDKKSVLFSREAALVHRLFLLTMISESTSGNSFVKSKLLGNWLLTQRN